MTINEALPLREVEAEMKRPTPPPPPVTDAERRKQESWRRLEEFMARWQIT